MNAYETRGEGPDLVLLAGGLDDHSAMAELASRLPGRRTWAVDTAGRGAAQWTTGRYRVQDIANHLAVFIAEQIGPTAVYGHSYGGAIAVVLAARHPDLVTALILGDAPIDREWLMDFRRRNNVAESVRAYAATMPNIDPDLVAANLDRADETYAALDPAALLPQITCPVLFIHADPSINSATTSEKLASAMRYVADGRTVSMAGIGHGLQSEDPGAVAEVIGVFLADHR